MPRNASTRGICRHGILTLFTWSIPSAMGRMIKALSRIRAHETREINVNSITEIKSDSSVTMFQHENGEIGNSNTPVTNRQRRDCKTMQMGKTLQITRVYIHFLYNNHVTA